MAPVVLVALRLGVAHHPIVVDYRHRIGQLLSPLLLVSDALVHLSLIIVMGKNVSFLPKYHRTELMLN